MENTELQKALSELGSDAIRWAATSGAAVLLILLLAYAVSRLFRTAARRLEQVMLAQSTDPKDHADHEEVKKRVGTLSSIVRKVGQVTIWTIAFMIVLKKLGVDIAPIIAGAGIIGLAVGFGAQSLVRDIISGFFIILENQVRVGDVAVINGTGGLVEGINLRTVVLRDLAGVVHIFPNGTISTLSNMTKGWSAMIFEIGVAYKEDTDRVVEVMGEVADELRQDDEFGKKIIEPLEILGVEKFDDSAVVIKARQKTKPIQQWAVGREYRRRLKKAFDAKGIEIPFPHRTLYWGEASRALEVQMGKDGTGTSTE